MSLIDEALKRARHEAARQEAAKRDASRHDGPRPVPRLYAERRPSRAPLWAGIASGVAVALLGLVVWGVWGRSPRVAPAAPAVESSSPGAGREAVRPAPPVETSRPAASPPVSSTAPGKPAGVQARIPDNPVQPDAPVPAAEPSTRARASTGAGSGGSITRQIVPESQAAPPVVRAAPGSGESRVAAPPPPPAPSMRLASPPSAAPSVPSASPGGSQTYVREAALPNGGPKLRLGGIAFSEEAPIALINGAALGRGEVVEGYVVRRIDAAEVELEGPAGRVVLRLK